MSYSNNGTKYSRELRWVLLNINQKALFHCVNRPLKNINFTKGTRHNQQKKIQQ